MTIGEQIRASRKKAKMTQKQLGEACGIAEPTIRRYELGKLNPKVETIQKIAKALNDPVLLIRAIPFRIEEQKEEIISSLENFPESVWAAQKNLEETLKRLQNSNFSDLFFDGQDEDNLHDEQKEELAALKADMIQKFDALNHVGKQKAHDYISDLSEQEKYLDNEHPLYNVLHENQETDDNDE